MSPASCDLDPLPTQNRPWLWILVIWKLLTDQKSSVPETGEICWMTPPTENIAKHARVIHEQEKGKNGSINWWVWFLPWLVFDVISLEEGPAQKSPWWEVVTSCCYWTCIMKMSDVTDESCSQVFCNWVDNCSANYNDFIHAMCSNCTRYISLFFNLSSNSFGMWISANYECCTFRHISCESWHWKGKRRLYKWD